MNNETTGKTTKANKNTKPQHYPHIMLLMQTKSYTIE